MANYGSPFVSTHPYSQESSYNNMMASLQNLDLGSSRNHDHGVLHAPHHSCFSPMPQGVDQSTTVQGPQLVGLSGWPLQSIREPLHGPVPCVPRSFIDRNIFPDQNGYFTEGFTQPMSHGQNGNQNQAFTETRSNGQNGYFTPGFTQPMSHGQNGNQNQAFTETRSNGQNGYNNQEFAGRNNGVPVQNLAGVTNLQDMESMAMRNECLLFLQNAVVVELVQCMRIMNKILCRAIPRDDQQTLNRIPFSVQDLPTPTRSKILFVGGLAPTVTESDLKTLFDRFGTITNVEVMYDHFTQRPRGFGFITFESEEAVENVLFRASFYELNGKMVEVKRAVPRDIYRKSIRGQLGGLNYGLSKVSNLLSAYTQGYNQAAVNRNGHPTCGPRYGMGPNLDRAGHPGNSPFNFYN